MASKISRATPRKSPRAKTQPAARRRASSAESQRIDLLMQAINEGVYDWDIVSGTIYYSDWVRRAVGLGAEELKTVADWRNRIHPDDLGRFDAALIEHLKGGTERFECDFRYRAKDDSWRWARTHGFSVRDSRGRATRMIGSTGDVTELKQTAEALRISEERYALATRAATEGIYDWNVETGELHLSDRARDVWGMPSGALTNESWIRQIHPKDYPGYRQAVVDHFRGRTPHFEHEFRARDASGEYRWVLDRGIGMRNPQGRVTRLIGVVRDNTERKRAEQELRRAHAETTAALEQQTATADILRVISSSPTDVQPVLDAVAASAARLCAATDAIILLRQGDELRFAAHHGTIPNLEVGGTRRISRGTTIGRSVLEGRQFHIHDLQAESAEFPEGSEYAREFGYRTSLVTPLMREGEAIGTIMIRRTEVRPFSEEQIALVQTFASQAVIAIENVRLFKELEARHKDLAETLEQQTATAGILRVISSTPTSTQPVFDAIVDSALHLFDGLGVGIMLRVGEQIAVAAGRGAMFGDESAVRARFPMPLSRDSASGQAILDRSVIHIADTEAPDAPPYARDNGRALGFRAMAVAPMMREGGATGAIGVARRDPGVFSEKQLNLLKTFADQAVIAIENVRLFNEIQHKSAQLETANRHKSEFLANMSHELRTPLNAIIGFSEVLGERYFGELTGKQDEYVKDIHGSGKHLLSLINDILDLSKIEAGRMELELADFDLKSAIDNALTLVKERAQRHGIALRLEIAPELGEIRADERKFKQVMLNLLSNAVKFTPDGGQVSVAAKPNGSSVEISVADSGPGIAPEDHAAVFEEFKQVGPHTASKAEGTGLGMPLAKRFVELHGGTIRLESARGRGATFTFTIPLRA